MDGGRDELRMNHRDHRRQEDDHPEEPLRVMDPVNVSWHMVWRGCWEGLDRTSRSALVG